MDGRDTDLEAALRSLAATPTLLVASDFDGTLAPIVTNAWEAAAPPAALRALSRLAEAPATSVAVITGRSLQGLVNLGPMPVKAHLVGSHGAEWSDGSTAPLTDDEARCLAEAQAAAIELLADAPGARLEHKPAGFAVHVRAMPDRALASELLVRIAAVVGSIEGVTLLAGKQVMEATVVHASKGEAIDRLRSLVGATAVFFAGDDVTDETAFAALGAGDVGVKVGPGPTSARFCVPSTTSVAEILGWLADARS
jgi:trehalose 6-phosphate phosphatase